MVGDGSTRRINGSCNDLAIAGNTDPASINSESVTASTTLVWLGMAATGGARAAQMGR